MFRWNSVCPDIDDRCRELWSLNAELSDNRCGTSMNFGVSFGSQTVALRLAGEIISALH